MAKIADMQEVSLNLLKPYERNAKIHGEDQIEKLMDSIREFGFLSPCIVERGTYNLIAGHGRIEAAKRLGMETVPCVFVEDITEEQRRAYILADNRLTELGEWDMDMVNFELAELYDAGFDVEITGFEYKSEPEDQGEDDYEEIESEQPRSKRGDIYQLGEHRLMCGDATEDVWTLMDGAGIDLLLTDPPYGISIVSGGKIGGCKPATFKGRVGAAFPSVCPVNEYRNIIGDENTDAARDLWGIIKDKIKNAIIFGGNYFTDFLEPSPCWIVWDKQTGENNFADIEMAWTSYDRHARLYKWMWNGMAREGDRESEGVKRVHPTQKPVGLFRNILEEFSETGEVVLDAFGGAGTTLIACEQTGRKCYMMELDPHYCDIIIDRWERLTGGKAVLLNG